MKILGHLRSVGIVGGASITLQQLLVELARRGHEVIIMGQKGQPKTLPYRVKVDIPRRPLDYYKWADIAITQLGATPDAMQWARASMTPLAHYVHDKGQLAKYRVANASLVIFNSEWLKKDTAWKGEQVVVNPPVFADQYRTRPGAGILLVGLLPEKGVELFYQLARLLPDKRFIGLKGRGRAVIPRTLPPNVEILNSVPSDGMREVYAKTRIVLAPSKETKTWVESWGRIGIEAAASGIPTFASRESPGLRESLGKYGIFLPCNNAEAWAAKIRELDDPAIFQKYSQGALKLSSLRDPEPQIDNLEIALLQIIANKWAGVRYLGVARDLKRPERYIEDRVDFFARQRHFIDHLAPVYRALPENQRGEFIVANGVMRSHAALLGIKAVTASDYIRSRNCNGGPIVIGALGSPLERIGRRRPLVLLNHGAGQTWVDASHASYAGGRGRNGITLFLEPGEHPAAKEKEAYPNARVEVVGCPKLDQWILKSTKARSEPPVVAISFHWDCKVTQETRSALNHFKSAIPELSKWQAEGEVKLLGHGHPAAWEVLERIWREHGIEPVKHFEEVMERADVYCCDQMSTLYEFAALDRPVVVMNAPWYRRDVDHGLRFWECANVGVQCNEPGDLIPAIKEALLDMPEQMILRQDAVRKVYTYLDGRSSERAVEAILELME